MEENKDIAGAENQQEPNKDEAITMTRAELDKQILSESDKRVAQALKTHDEKKAVEFEKRLAQEKKEAARLASLSEEERHQAELVKRESEAETREKELTKRELHLDAIKIVNERNIPVSFAKYLLADNAADTLKNIDEFTKEWKNGLDKEVEQRMHGGTPAAGKPASKSTDMNEIIRGRARK
jgi:hypothetical protein